MIRRFLTKLVSTVRTVVRLPFLQKAVFTLIIRTRIVVEVLTGTFHTRPDVQHLQRVKQTHVIPPYSQNLTPFNSTFFRQRW